MDERNHWSALSREHDRETFITVLHSGDIIAPYTLPVLCEFLGAHPGLNLVYGDEDSIGNDGRHRDPELKPDWSPIFARRSRYLGRAVFVRSDLLRRNADVRIGEMLDADYLQRTVIRDQALSVGHVRRILLSKSQTRDRPPIGTVLHEGTFVGSASTTTSMLATVVIPSKDRVQMLAACLDGLRRTKVSNFEVIIVDNGSQDEATWAFYASLSGDQAIRLLKAPGPFNFSALCNKAAAAAKGQLLVFLNNDTFGMQPDWLEQLAAWAIQPGVGAAGVKLLYPSGCLQHGGVVLGLMGYAAHIDVGANANYKGYLGRMAVAHEISAVTAACMAVEKQRFDAVGGFDAENFPVELGDVDLCLRLNQNGLKTIMLPDVVLLHHESASRGKTPATENAYSFEKSRFFARWGHMLDNDPYFHPALSLNSVQTMLE